MKIIIKQTAKEKCRTVRIPLAIAANPVTAAALAGKTELSFKQTQALMKAFKRSAKLLNDQPFVEVCEENGDKVQIFL